MKIIFKYHSFSFLLFFFASSFLTANENKIVLYLDSGDYEMAHERRVDKMLYYAIEAEQIADQTESLNPLLKQRIELNYSTIFQSIRQIDFAIEHLKKWLELVSVTNKKGVMYTINTSRIASNYMSINEIDSAKKYFQQSLDFSISEGKSLYISSGLNNLGVFYYKQYEFELAKKYYLEAIEILDSNTNKEQILAISIRDNLADYYLAIGDTNKAIQLITKNIEKDLYDNKKHHNFLKYNLKLYDLFLTKKNFIKASHELNYLDSIIHKDKTDSISLVFKKDVIKRMLKGSINVSFIELSNELNLINDKIISKQEIDLSQLNESINRYLIRVSEKEKKNLINKSNLNNERNRNKQLVLLGSLVLLVLIIVLTFLIYRFRLKVSHTEKKLKEQELKVQFLENRKLSKDLDLKRNDFSDLHMQITLEDNFSKEIIERLKKIKSEINVDLSSEIGNLIRDLNQKTAVFEKLEIQKKGMKEVNSSFFEKLDKRFPELTKSERELCGMIRLRLDGKEIAMIRNIQPSSVRKLRYRLRKKIGIEHTDNIYEFISKV